MPRYIDADVFRDTIMCQPKNISVNYVLELVSKAPTADVVERKKGKWLPYEFGTKRWHKCSACGIADEYINEKGLEARREFCPHCGAEMCK